jgi:hypothetical protein
MQARRRSQGGNNVNSTRRTLRSEAGSTLVVVSIFAIVMLISALALVELGAQDAALAVRDVHASQAFYNAEAGVERGESWILGQATPPPNMVRPFGSAPETFGGGLALISITPGTMGSRTIYTIRSFATLDGRSRAIEADVTPSAFTDYLYYTNQDVGPGSPGYFRTGDVIDGPIHLNDILAVWGDPVFQAEIHTTGTEILYQNNWDPMTSTALSNAPYDNPVFQEGIQLGAQALPWLDEGDLNTLAHMAGLALSNVDMVFGRDDGSGPMLGYVSYSKVGRNEWTDVELDSFNGIIYVNGTCNISGVVDGQATVVNNATIEIVDDLTYADSDANGPRPGCDDILGLIASTKVAIADNLANQDDCVVHAHFMSMNNQASFVDNYTQGTPRGTLSIYGGLAQDKWGPVGTGYYDYDGTFHVLTGYERDFHYDWRLRSLLPPGYDAIVFKGGNLDRIAWREITPVDLTGWEG